MICGWGWILGRGPPGMSRRPGSPAFLSQKNPSSRPVSLRLEAAFWPPRTTLKEKYYLSTVPRQDFLIPHVFRVLLSREKVLSYINSLTIVNSTGMVERCLSHIQKGAILDLPQISGVCWTTGRPALVRSQLGVEPRGVHSPGGECDPVREARRAPPRGLSRGRSQWPWTVMTARLLMISHCIFF